MRDTSSRLHAAKQELSDLMQEEMPFRQKARGALEVGRQYLGVANGHLTRIDRETNHWEAIVSTDDRDGSFPEGQTLDLQTTYCRRTLAAAAPIALYDAPNQGWDADPAFEEHGLHCYHGTTVHVNGEPYGTICFVSEDPRREPFSETETLFIEYLTQSLERELESERHEAELTRQTNLSTVLNRILRHNLRNDIAVIRGFTQLMADQLEDTFYSETALTKIDRLIELCEKARQLDQIIAAESERESTAIALLVEEVVETVTRKYPAASITVESDEAITAAVFPSFGRAIRELIENAAKHGGDAPTITVRLELVPNGIEIEISDDSPGLATHEMDVFDTGTETPLTHGTGLGLWLSYWIITGHDGSIEATDTGNGTTLSISIPRTSNPDKREQLRTLTRTRGQYQAAFDEAGDGMTIINDEARIVDLNTEAAAIYGTERQQLLGRSIREFLPNTFDFDAEWDAIRTADTRRDEMPITTADGGVSAIEYTAQTDIVPGLHLLISRDVTERREREGALEETTQRLESVIELSPDPILAIDTNGTITVWNEAAEDVFGFAAGDVLGERIRSLDLFDEDRATQFEERLERVTGGETIRDHEVRRRTRQGSPAHLSLSVAPLRDESGTVTGVIAVAKDITEYKEREREQTELETELKRQNDRLEAFTSAVSHDLRNPLSVAEGRLDLAAAECDSEHFEHIERAHSRMYDLIDDLLTLARVDERLGDLESVGLAVIATGCWKNVETGRATLVIESDRTIQSDESRLKQLFENLMRNSVEHSSTGSRTESDDRIEHSSTGPDSQARQDSVEHDGEGVTVTVGTLDGGFYIEDDGCGIPAGRRNEIFETGYSTNRDGTGFGLSIVQRIVAAHGWEISATESSDGGARFEITGVSPST